MLHCLNQDSLLNDHNCHNGLSLLLSSCWIGSWGALGLFPARSENAAKNSGTCNTFHGLPGDKLCQFKLVPDDLGLWATCSMSLLDSLNMVLHGPCTKPFPAAGSNSFSSTISLLTHLCLCLATWHSAPWLSLSNPSPLLSQDVPRRIPGTTGLSAWHRCQARLGSSSSWVCSPGVWRTTRGSGPSSIGSWKASPAWPTWSPSMTRWPA